jgi:riboflavin biosynthesis pyrimidine reductase
MIGPMRQIHPTCAGPPVDLAALYGTPRPSVDGRPWVGLCMIASIDGATAVDGRSGGLGNAGDRAVFHTLRDAADVILVGAKTAAAEHYGPASRPGQRIGVVSARGSVDTNSELFTSGSGFLVLPEDGPPTPDGVDVVRAGRGIVDLAAALRRLEAVAPDVAFVQAEGGAQLNGALLDADCIDELDVSIVGGLVGGASGRMVAGASESLRSFRLAHVLVDDDGYLFTRWLHPDRTVPAGHRPDPSTPGHRPGPC